MRVEDVKSAWAKSKIEIKEIGELEIKVEELTEQVNRLVSTINLTGDSLTIKANKINLEGEVYLPTKTKLGNYTPEK